MRRPLSLPASHLKRSLSPLPLEGNGHEAKPRRPNQPAASEPRPRRRFMAFLLYRLTERSGAPGVAGTVRATHSKC
jgi:hypothetical protein